MGVVADEIVSKLKAAASRGIVDRLQRNRERRQPYRPPLRATFEDVVRKRAVAIGISTGGPATLQEVLPLLPPDLPASIFLVQHMPPAFVASFAKRLGEHCALKVVEGRSGMPVEPGVCYVAPGGMHLCLHRKMTGEVVTELSDGSRVQTGPGSVTLIEDVNSKGHRTWNAGDVPMTGAFVQLAE